MYSAIETNLVGLKIFKMVFELQKEIIGSNGSTLTSLGCTIHYPSTVCHRDSAHEHSAYI